MHLEERTPQNIADQKAELDAICERVPASVARVLQAWAAGGTTGDPFVFVDKGNTFLWWISTESKGGVSGSVLKISPERGKKPVGWRVREKGTTDRGVQWMRVRSDAVFRRDSGKSEGAQVGTSPLPPPLVLVVHPQSNPHDLLGNLKKRFSCAFRNTEGLAQELGVALALTPEACPAL